MRLRRHKRGADRLPADQAGSIRYFANPGPAFEERGTPQQPTTDTRARAIAFYLPQFHAFPENDQWWGTGFTEWRNVSRGTPRYQGHYQPRIPRDLGFYDLNHVDVLKAQSALARAAGINAFCFYYYWFNGKRLMDKPLDLFADSEIDQEFCIMWANENWTRRWDGRNEDVLISQQYHESDENDFIADTARYMAHPRYTRLDGRPLFILYRPCLLPQPRDTIERWRDKWTAILGESPLIFMVQSYLEFDPAPFGCDGAIEFPPHKVSRDLKRQNRHFTIFDPDYSGQIRAYQDVVDKSLNEPAPLYPLIKTVSPHWDNDARREGRGVTFQGSTPAAYARWLNGAIDFAQANPVAGESLVFINAWNEWAEAAYLEPDVHYGHAYLNATWRTLQSRSINAENTPLLLVGHDAHANGAQMLLLSLARVLATQFGVDIRIVLKRGGALLSDYEAVASTVILEGLTYEEQRQWFARCGCRQAVFNTSVTGDLLQAARLADIHCVCLVHEMPTLIREFSLQSQLSEIAHLAHHVVFPSQVVRRGFETFEPVIHCPVTIRPQGLYRSIAPDAGAYAAIRRRLGIAPDTTIVLNAGYADHRKGFDLFALAARELCRADASVHFCWLGKRTRAMNRWLKSTIGRTLKGRLHLIEFTHDVQPWYSAADCLYLSSREDPFPSVVLEALSIGLPVVVHEHTTGFDESILAMLGRVRMDDTVAVAESIRAAVHADTDAQRNVRRRHIQAHYRLDDYAAVLLTLSGVDTDTPGAAQRVRLIA